MVDKQRLRTFILGGAIGALAGILVAPRSGRELRRTITNRAGEARERGRETYFEAQERMQERIARTREAPGFSPETEPGREEDLTTSTGIPETPQERPRLRDLSREGAPDERAQELRKKVQETRERLRRRLDTPGPGEAGDE